MKKYIFGWKAARLIRELTRFRARERKTDFLSGVPSTHPADCDRRGEHFFTTLSFVTRRRSFINAYNDDGSLRTRTQVFGNKAGASAAIMIRSRSMAECEELKIIAGWVGIVPTMPPAFLWASPAFPTWPIAMVSPRSNSNCLKGQSSDPNGNQVALQKDIYLIILFFKIKTFFVNI
jgi:hypothetical protein